MFLPKILRSRISVPGPRGDYGDSLAAPVNHSGLRDEDGRCALNVGVSEQNARASERRRTKLRSRTGRTARASEDGRARAEKADTAREGSSRYSMVSVPSRRGSGLDVASSRGRFIIVRLTTVRDAGR